MGLEVSPWEESPTQNDLLSLQTERELRYEDVVAEAGDMPADGPTTERLRRMRSARGDGFYAELWFVLTHRRFEPARARSLWHRTLAHKAGLERRLGRNVGIGVAALDYLHNVEGDLVKPVVLESGRLERIATAATHDDLTGLFDKRAMYAALQREMARALREDTSLGVVMLDVDHFKRFNDAHGHLEGDEVLRRVAQCCVDSVREMDLVCRYGGEEFCLVLPGAGCSQSVRIAERVRDRVRGEGLPTVSLGVAALRGGLGSPEQLLEVADEALYQAKQEGRNRTYVATSSGMHPAAVAPLRHERVPRPTPTMLPSTGD